LERGGSSYAATIHVPTVKPEAANAVVSPSPGAYNCISSLWFYRWSVVVAA